MDARLTVVLESVPVPESGCWIWSGDTKSRGGYGRVFIDGGMVMAHRFSWMAYNGEIPPGSIVCHRCDTPPCVNPEHLFLGSHKDNANDREAKGRGNQVKHETHGRAKLDNAQVEEIRAWLHAGEPQSFIARQYGVSQQTISAIKTGAGWYEGRRSAHARTAFEEK